MTCFLGYSLPSWIFSADWGDEFREGALQLSVGGIFFGSSMLLLPFCASVPYAISQVDEIRTSFLEWEGFEGINQAVFFQQNRGNDAERSSSYFNGICITCACLEFYRLSL